MIFNNPPKLPSANGVAKYLQTVLWGWMQNLSTGLRKLGLVENFQAIPVTVTIAGTSAVTFANPFGSIPTYRLIVLQNGPGPVSDGNWTRQFLSLINNGSDPVTVTVIYYL